jgi:hypothetical protein
MLNKLFHSHEFLSYKSAGDESVPRIAVAAATSGLTK